jgi:hypothetical protein
MTIRRTLVTALAAAALVAPAAQAQPADVHASTAQPAAKADQPPKQDLRTPDARDAAVTLHRSRHAVNAPGATAVGSASELPRAVPAGGGGGGGELAPAQVPAPAPALAPAPAAQDGGSSVPVIPLVGAALLVLVAALTARPLARHMARRAPVA